MRLMLLRQGMCLRVYAAAEQGAVIHVVARRCESGASAAGLDESMTALCPMQPTRSIVTGTTNTKSWT